MKKIESPKAEKKSIKVIDDLSKQKNLNTNEGKSFTIEEARIYSKNKIAQLSKI